MPDLITHLCGAQIIRKAFRLGIFPAFALGAILPDLISRPLHIIFPGTYWYVAPFHSPLVCVLYCVIISLLFASGIRRKVFILLSSGVALHLFLDLLQKQLSPHYFWLFPFSWKSWWIGLFWPEGALFLLPVTAGATLVVTYLLRGQ